MKLSDFLRNNADAILGQWDTFAQQVTPEGALGAAALRDHARGMLEVIADDLDSTQSEVEQQAKSRGMAPRPALKTEASLHGSSRFAEGFDVNQTMAEFRALRASVLRLWGETSAMPGGDVGDIMRFNEAIDQAVAESLASYSELRSRRNRLFEVLLSSSPDLNYIVEPNGTLLYANRAFADVFGKPPGELIGVDFISMCKPFVNDIEKRIRQVAGSRKTCRAEMCPSAGLGDGRIFEYLLVPVLNQAGRCEAIAGSARDITERKAAEERMRRSANYDSLTNLPNRCLFRERLALEIKHSARAKLALGLLFIDLDFFKEVNDQYGHAAGDQLLQQVAERIGACVRDTDMVARLGGDEFTVILTNVTAPDHIANISAEIISELHRSFALAAGDVTISASIGVTLYPQHGTSPDDLVRNADEAMYASKNAGRNQYQIFTAAMRCRDA